MRTLKLILTLIIFLNVSTPSQFFAQELVENTATSLEDDEIKVEKKKDKKKKEEKIEEVHIDSRFLLNAGIDIMVMLVIIGFIYHRNYNKSEILFTFFAFNMVIFLLTYVMNHVKISMGAAFGLFAIFSMLRYRTEGIAPKDMTYLFIVIAIGMICAIKISVVTLLVICAILIAVVLLFDGNILFKRQFLKPIIYDNVSLIRPNQLPELIADLKERTGLNIYKVNIVRIDYLKDMAIIDVYYHD